MVALIVLAAALAWWSFGRHGDSDVPVSGRVFIDGRPLSGGLVILYPDLAKGNLSPLEPRGRTDRNGRYRLQTEGRKGAAPGWYKVAVVIPGEPKKPAGGPQRLNPRYATAETSRLSMHVTDRPEPGAYDLYLAKWEPRW